MSRFEVNGRHAASFRDPSGFLFCKDGIIYRQVNWDYKECYDRLITCGLYSELIAAGFLIPHEEVELAPNVPDLAYKILKPAGSVYLLPLRMVFQSIEGCRTGDTAHSEESH